MKYVGIIRFRKQKIIIYVHILQIIDDIVMLVVS